MSGKAKAIKGVAAKVGSETPVDKENLKQQKRNSTANDTSILVAEKTSVKTTAARSSQKQASTDKKLAMDLTSTPQQTSSPAVDSKLSPQSKIKNEKNFNGNASLVKAEPVDPLDSDASFNKINGHDSTYMESDASKHVLIDSNKQNLIATNTSTPNSHQNLATSKSTPCFNSFLCLLKSCIGEILGLKR